MARQKRAGLKVENTAQLDLFTANSRTMGLSQARADRGGDAGVGTCYRARAAVAGPKSIACTTAALGAKSAIGVSTV